MDAVKCEMTERDKAVEQMVGILQQLDGRTVGLLGYSSNTRWDGSRRLIIAEDLLSPWHIDLHVEVGDVAFLTLWRGDERMAERMILDCDNAPDCAVELLREFQTRLAAA